MKVETGHRRKLEQLKNPDCLAYRDDSTTQLYGDYVYIYIHSIQQASIRIPINLPVLWNVASFFSCSLLTCIGRHTFKEGDSREQHSAVF